jgi:hypothetical protein
VAAASYPSSVIGSGLLAVYVILLPALGILAIALVMREGPFSRAAANVGVLTGILGIVSVVGPYFWSPLGTVVILTSVLTTVWVLLVGYGLLRLRQR